MIRSNVAARERMRLDWRASGAHVPCPAGSLRGPRSRRRHHHRQPAGQRAEPRRAGRHRARPSRAPTPTPAADAIVLIGAGTTFIAGADINVFKTLKTREQSLDAIGRHARAAAGASRMSAKPLVAAIHGNALGGGLEVAMACHYRVASQDAKVGQPEVLLGIIPGAGGTQRLPRLCGAELALEMCTDGKPVPAPKALAAGIVDRDRRRRSADGRDRVRAGARGGRRDPQDARRSRSVADARRPGSRRARRRASALAKTARGARAPFAAVDAIEAGADAGLRRRARSASASCSPTASSRPSRRRCVICSSPSARSRRFPTCPKDTPAHDDQARRGRRRRHDGRRHRDDLRQRRHPGAAEGRRRGGARARPGDDPQELRSRRCRRAR